MLSQFTTVDKRQVQAIASIINAGITYLTIFEENCRMYNDIDIQSDEGWQQIAEGIDIMIDMMVK